jgi:hypothetical protein
MGVFFSFWSTLFVSSHLIFMYAFCKFCCNQHVTDPINMCWVASEQSCNSTKLYLPYGYIIHMRVGAEKDDSQIFVMRWCTCILWSYLRDLESTITHLHTHARVRVKALRPRVRDHAYFHTKLGSSIGKSTTKNPMLHINTQSHITGAK